jgi:hypothetical protein
MANTIRELILQDLQVQAAKITVVNGYNTNIGGTTARGRSAFGPGELPAVNIIDKPEEVEKRFGKNACTMEVLIEAIVDYGDSNPSVISNQMLGDLIKAFTNTTFKATLTEVDSIQYIRGGTDDYPEEKHKTVGAFATFQIKYNTDLGDPYTQ